MLSGWPLLIAVVKGPSSVTVELGGSVPLSWSCGATAMPAPCRPSSGQLWAITGHELPLRYSTSVAVVKYPQGCVVGRGCAASVTRGAYVTTDAVLARVSTLRSAQRDAGGVALR
jgi:hypothetical protein